MREEPDCKTCSRCHKSKPLTQFSADRNRKDGHYPYCKACVSQQRREREARTTTAECTVEGCERPMRTRTLGVCNMHYRRLKKHGDVGSAEAIHDLRDTECSYCGSTDGPIIQDSTYPGGGLCQMHQGRWRRHRNLGPKGRLTRKAPADNECTHVMPDNEKCRNRYVAAGLCAMHYQRVAAGRDLDDPGIDTRIPESEAVEQMTRAGATPLGEYVNTTTPWACQCSRCYRHIKPTLEAVRRDHDPCWYCSGSRIDPVEAEQFMMEKGMTPIAPWPGRGDRRWRGIHTGTSEKSGCLGEVAPTYHSVKTHEQGVCFNCGERGYSTNKPGSFYVVDNETIVKCGIANMKNFKRRISAHAGQGLRFRWAVGFLDGQTAWDMEREWKAFRMDRPELHVTKAQLRDGYTEAMTKNSIVLDFLLELSSESITWP